jgi:PAS domain S-box-containing protein
MSSTGKPKRLESSLHRVFEAAWEAMMIVDDGGKLIKVNPSACQLLGLTREELLNQSLGSFLLINLEEEEQWQVFWQTKQEVAEISLICADGSRITVEYTAVTDFVPHRHLLVLRDISQRKQAEAEERQRQHQRLQLFSEVTLKIRQSLQLKEILQTTVTEVQRILRADRVLIYQVFANGTGKPISEAALPDYAPILGVCFLFKCFVSLETHR